MPQAEGHLAARGGLTQRHHQHSWERGGSPENLWHLTFSCHEGHRLRMSGCPLSSAALTLATKDAPHLQKKLPTTWGHCRGTSFHQYPLFPTS